MEAIRPSSDLRNHYSEISKQCHEERNPVIITVNGHGDTAILGLQDYYQMKSELGLRRHIPLEKRGKQNANEKPQSGIICGFSFLQKRDLHRSLVSFISLYYKL